MPAKRSVNKSVTKDVKAAKRAKPPNELVDQMQSDANKLSAEDEEKIYLLQRDKSLLMSNIKKIKKDLSEMRAALQDREFKALQDPQKKEDKFPEFLKNVELWSETVGINLNEVTYGGKGTRDWCLKGNAEEVHFELNILCATNDSTQKGYVKNFAIECSEPCKQELQPWLNNNGGNIEQIIKILKVYSELSKEREVGLNTCKNEFGPIVNISLDASGETVVELGTNNFYYFQIRWKITPSSKHFAKLKNTCRIACTEDGDKLLKANSITSIRKRLCQSPIEVIQHLAREIIKEENNEK